MGVLAPFFSEDVSTLPLSTRPDRPSCPSEGSWGITHKCRLSPVNWFQCDFSVMSTVFKTIPPSSPPNSFSLCPECCLYRTTGQKSFLWLTGQTLRGRFTQCVESKPWTSFGPLTCRSVKIVGFLCRSVLPTNKTKSCNQSVFAARAPLCFPNHCPSRSARQSVAVSWRAPWVPLESVNRWVTRSDWFCFYSCCYIYLVCLLISWLFVCLERRAVSL